MAANGHTQDSSSININSLKDFKGKDNRYVAEWLGENGLEKLIDSFERKYLVLHIYNFVKTTHI
jgi:hypothetical protein